MKKLRGTIVSTKMKKTVVVEVVKTSAHPLYKKLVARSKKYKVDTGSLTSQVGDKVEIQEVRPISKDKHFKLLKILNEEKKDAEFLRKKT